MEAAVKAYLVQCVGRFVLNDSVSSSRVPRAFLDEVKHHQTALKPNAWVDRKILVDALRAVAAAHDGDDQGAYRALVGCGNVVADYAAGSFLRLLLKMVTPKLLAKKLPDLWTRDHRNAGRLEVEPVHGHTLVVRAKELNGYDHFGPFGMGFIGPVLSATGVKNFDIRLVSPWSLTEPSAPEVHIIATWQ